MALEKFLTRVADHPVLSFDKNFQIFLTAKAWVSNVYFCRTCLSKGGLGVQVSVHQQLPFVSYERNSSYSFVPIFWNYASVSFMVWGCACALDIIVRFFFCHFLAHLSRMLTRWAYSIPMVRHPSVVVVVRRPHFQTWISLKPDGQSWSNFMCSITGVGERLHKVLGQIGSKLWFPWQQKAPIDL